MVRKSQADRAHADRAALENTHSWTLLSPMNWSFRALLGMPSSTGGDSSIVAALVASLGYGGLFLFSRFWLDQVTKYVPEPYLDEVFHIPQAQAYCRGELHVWDPKITTPPGLYAISIALIGRFTMQACTVFELRAVNSISLLFLLFLATQCRRLIEKPSASMTQSRVNLSPYNALHTALNICLFPPLFFFSGLYYTDVLSTTVVVGGYYIFQSLGAGRHPISGGAAMYVLGVAALFMRQTNIFWVAVFAAALEWVRSCKRTRPYDANRLDAEAPNNLVQQLLGQSLRGYLYDPKLADAGIVDQILCVISIALSALGNPFQIVLGIWPYIFLLLSFTTFIVWNGGVVLGDKSNHVATIHLPQMLYIWPFIAFFSAPLIYPYAISMLYSLHSALRRSGKPGLKAKPLTPFQNGQAMVTFGAFVLTLLSGLAIVHFNTIIHPFTLADNRHYVFYAFRYTIRRQPLIKYALVPIYVLCGWLSLRCLAGTSSSSKDSPNQTPSTAISTSGFVYNDSQVTKRGNRKVPSLDTASPKQLTPGRDSDGLVSVIHAGPDISFAFIWTLSTALSLITAPLVEPRYYILPWVLWRLHVPPLMLRTSRPTRSTLKPSGGSVYKQIKYWVYQTHDHRLWLETIWFLVINVVTGFVFLFRGFEWPQEPGKVQRFMW